MARFHHNTADPQRHFNIYLSLRSQSPEPSPQIACFVKLAVHSSNIIWVSNNLTQQQILTFGKL